MSSAPEGLRLRDVSFAYRRATPVLEAVDLEVVSGELVVLVGANGSGKSTLLRLAGGLREADHGAIRWREREVRSWPMADRAREIALLPQSVQPVHRLLAREVVELGRHPHRGFAWAALTREDRDAVVRALEACDARELAERDFDDLSGGERQRVLLASALAQGGRLLLLDEPTAALDLPHQVQAFEKLRALAREGRAVLVATHDLNLAACFADRVYLMHRGRVAASGTAEEVLRPEILEATLGPGLWVGAHPAAPVPVVLPLPSERGS